MPRVSLEIALKAVDQASAVFGKVEGRLDSVKKKLDEGRAASARTAAAVRGIGTAATAAGGVVIAALGGMTIAAARSGDEIAKASGKTGVHVESLSRLRFAADQSGVSFTELESALGRQARAATEAANGTAMYAETYDRLGVSVTDANGNLKDGETLFRETAGALAAIESPTERAALAMDIFGRSGANMLPLLNQGEEGLDALGKRAEELGLIFTEDAAKASEEFNDALAQVKDSLGGAAKEIGVVVMPVVTKLATTIATTVGKVSAWAKEHPTLTKTLVAVALAVAGLLVFLGPVLIAVSQLIPLFSALSAAGGVAGVTGMLGGLGTTLAGLAAAGGPILLVVAALGVMFWSLKRTINMAKEASEAFHDQQQAALALADTLGDTAPKGSWWDKVKGTLGIGKTASGEYIRKAAGEAVTPEQLQNARQALRRKKTQGVGSDSGDSIAAAVQRAQQEVNTAMAAAGGGDIAGMLPGAPGGSVAAAAAGMVAAVPTTAAPSTPSLIELVIGLEPGLVAKHMDTHGGRQVVTRIVRSQGAKFAAGTTG